MVVVGGEERGKERKGTLCYKTIREVVNAAGMELTLPCEVIASGE